MWSEARLIDRLDITFPVSLLGASPVGDVSAVPKPVKAKRGATGGEGGGVGKRLRGSECASGSRPEPVVHVLSDDDSDDFY